MKYVLFILALTAPIALIIPTVPAQAPALPDPAGIWEGKLAVGGAGLRVVLHVSRGPDGALAATLDSPDQGATGIPITKIEFAGDVLRFESAGIGARYEGRMAADGASVSGEFAQGGGKFPLAFARVEKPSEVVRPQNPVKPYPYREEAVVYDNVAGGAKLAGTLTLPSGEGPFACVLLITGSGPQDRDETLLGHKPFLVLADHLTRRGIAVLRVDDRGIGSSTGDLTHATSEDFAGDVRAGIEFLKSHKEIDPKRIGLAGHSEGGMIAPMVAAKSTDVAFLVLLAGPAVTGEEILLAQGERIMRTAGATAEQLKQQRDTQTAIFAIVKAEADPAVAKRKVTEYLMTEFDKLPAAQKAAAGDPGPAVEAQARSATSAWFRYFLLYDPRPALQHVKCPVLALNGELDVQVPHDQNLPELRKALEAGGCPDITTTMLPRLNHLFQTATTGGLDEYGRIDETMAPVALNTIADWIVAHTEKR